MKNFNYSKSLILSLITILFYYNAQSQSCSNLDFENGFTNWSGSSGNVENGNNGPHLSYIPNSNTLGAPNHTLVNSASGNDEVVGSLIPKLNPFTGNVSLRLGDGPNTGAHGASIQNTFNVSNSNPIFIYYYAAVLEDPSGHSLQEKPMFKVDVTDCNGSSISCGDYLVISNAPGFKQIPNASGYYKSWTPVFMDLSNYIGSCVTIKFTSGDCTQGGHFGYAYVDGTCSKLEIEGPDTFCLGGVNEIINAPLGAEKYEWKIQGQNTIIGTSSQLSISPTQTTIYECQLTSVTGCLSTITKKIVVINTPGPQLNDIANIDFCGNQLDLAQITGVNLTGNESYYNNSQANSGTLISAPLSGNQTVWVYDNLFNCISEKSFDVNFLSSPTINNPGKLTSCDSINLPVISGTNLSGDQAYYDDSQSNGGQLINDLLLFNSQTVWIYDKLFTCESEINFEVEILNTPILNPINDTVVCDVLPNLKPIKGIYLSGNENYYNDSQSNGGKLLGGNLNQSQTIWAYDFKGNCKNEISFDLTVYETPQVDFTSDRIEGCVPLKIMFENKSQPFVDKVTWSFGDGNYENADAYINSVEHTYKNEGCYDVTLISSYHDCSNSVLKEDFICTFPNPVANFAVDSFSKSIFNPVFNFLDETKIGYANLWEFGDGFNSSDINPKHFYNEEAGKYYVTLFSTNEYGCLDTITKPITIRDEVIFYIPNSFTPNNGDGINNIFKAEVFSGIEIENFSMYIFNRWGEIVFESHDLDKGWDGKLGGEGGSECQEGLYLWKVFYKEKILDARNILTGHVVLLK